MVWFSWLWNVIPWWAFVTVGIILIAVFWNVITPIWAILPKPVKALIIFIGSIFVATQYGRNRGQQSERDKQAANDAHAIRNRDRIDEQVGNMQSGDVTRDLERNKWLRD